MVKEARQVTAPLIYLMLIRRTIINIGNLKLIISQVLGQLCPSRHMPTVITQGTTRVEHRVCHTTEEMQQVQLEAILIE